MKVGDRSRWRPEGSLFNSYYSKVLERALLLSLDWSTLHLIRALYCWELSKEVSSTIFKVFGMTPPGIEPGSPRLLANTLPTKPYITLIIIIIIKSCRQTGYPWPSLATSPYRSLLLAGLQGYIPYPHRAAVCMFELVVLLLLGHMWGSIGVHHWWVRPCFSSSVLRVSFV